MVNSYNRYFVDNFLLNLYGLDDWNMLNDFIWLWNFNSFNNWNFLCNFNLLDYFLGNWDVSDDFNYFDNFLNDWNVLDDLNFLDYFNYRKRFLKIFIDSINNISYLELEQS